MSDKIIELFADELEIDAAAINDETSPDNTDSWDSLAAMNLVARIEETFGVQLSTGEIMKMRTVGLVREILKEKGADTGA